MTKELLIEILTINGNLYTIIDNFIELNYDQRYGANIQEIFDLTCQLIPTLSYDHQGYGFALFSLGAYINYRLYFMLKNVLTNEGLATFFYNKLRHDIEDMTLDSFYLLGYQVFNITKVSGGILEIALFFNAFKDYLFITKTFNDLFINNIATFIYNEIQAGNVSPEFIEYLNTFLQ